MMDPTRQSLIAFIEASEEQLIFTWRVGSRPSLPRRSEGVHPVAENRDVALNQHGDVLPCGFPIRAQAGAEAVQWKQRLDELRSGPRQARNEAAIQEADRWADSRVQDEIAERLLMVQALDGLGQQRGQTHPVHGERQMGRRRHAVGRQESSDG